MLREHERRSCTNGNISEKHLLYMHHSYYIHYSIKTQIFHKVWLDLLLISNKTRRRRNVFQNPNFRMPYFDKLIFRLYIFAFSPEACFFESFFLASIISDYIHSQTTDPNMYDPLDNTYLNRVPSRWCRDDNENIYIWWIHIFDVTSFFCFCLQILS